MKLSERAAQIFHSRAHSCAENMVGALADALDEWQASVEERLGRLTPRSYCGENGPTRFAAGHSTVPFICELEHGHAGPHADTSERGQPPVTWTKPSKCDAEPEQETE